MELRMEDLLSLVNDPEELEMNIEKLKSNNNRAKHLRTVYEEIIIPKSKLIGSQSKYCPETEEGELKKEDIATTRSSNSVATTAASNSATTTPSNSATAAVATVQTNSYNSLTSSFLRVPPTDIRARKHILKRVEIHGKELRLWICGICQKEFKYQYNLIRHIPVHTDVRHYSCHLCGRAFRQMSTLKQHLITHSGVRPHRCQECGKSFHRSSTLLAHRNIHSSAKAFTCHYCGKGFHQKGNLKNHMFIHTDVRPYKCELCGQGFNQMSNLNVHKNNKHFNGLVFTCTVCKIEFTKYHQFDRHLHDGLHDILVSRVDGFRMSIPARRDLHDLSHLNAMRELERQQLQKVRVTPSYIVRPDLSCLARYDPLKNEILPGVPVKAEEEGGSGTASPAKVVKEETLSSSRAAASAERSAQQSVSAPATEGGTPKKTSFKIKRGDSSLLPLIEKKPTPEMFDVFAQNQVPFVYFHSLQLGKPAICKAVLEGDFYRLKNLNVHDMRDRTEISLTVEIHEVDMDGEIEYLVAPCSKTMKVQAMAAKLKSKKLQ